jgi:hypothetical protein
MNQTTSLPLALFFLLLLLAANSFAQTYDFRLCTPAQTAAQCRCPVLHVPLRTVNVKILGSQELERAQWCKSLAPELSVLTNVLPHVGEPPCNCPSAPGLAQPESLVSRVLRFPANCGYEMSKFRGGAFQNQTVSHFMRTDEVLCGAGGANHSMCTSATFLAFMFHAKKLYARGQITKAQLDSWTDIVNGPVWKGLNNIAQPDVLMRQLGVGTGKAFRATSLPQTGWPSKGDFIQIWRKSPPVSGHSAIALGRMHSPTGADIGVCFWTSNYATNGYGIQCEKYADMETLRIGRLN